MNKIKFTVIFLLVFCIMMSNTALAYAAESRVDIVPVGNYSVEGLSEQERESLQQELGRIGDEEGLPLIANASYEPFRYSESFDIYIDGGWVARADAECIVWHYTDGKVHLYHRTITVRRLSTYDAVRTYGSIVNTDGSLSYTTGDRVRIIAYMDYWDFAIDFRVTPTEASFDCYEV